MVAQTKMMKMKQLQAENQRVQVPSFPDSSRPDKSVFWQCAPAIHYIFNPHQRCGYSDLPFARMHYFYAAGSRKGLKEGWTVDP